MKRGHGIAPPRHGPQSLWQQRRPGPAVPVPLLPPSQHWGAVDAPSGDLWCPLVSPAGWESSVLPTRRQARRGWAFYSLPPGWHNSAPPLGELSPQATERAPFKKRGLSKGGISPPFGIKLYKTVPLPRLRGNSFRRGLGAGGGQGGGYHKTFPAGETGVGLSKLSYPAGETEAAPSPEAGNKKEGRSIVYSPSGWYDNAPTLLRCGCAAFKAARLCLALCKLFVKSLTKNF